MTLVIPAFNEARRLPRTLAVVKETLTNWRLDYRVIVVDDGSIDKTAELTAGYGRRFRTLRMTRQCGKGAAVRAGMLLATGRVAAFTDADLPFDLKALHRAYALVRDEIADIVCGARDLAASQASLSRSVSRQIASWVFRGVVHRLLTLPVADPQCGLKVFSQRARESLFPLQRVSGFSFDAEILYLAERMGLTCTTVPVHQINEYGSSVSVRRHAVPMMLDLLRIRWHDWTGAYARAAAHQMPVPAMLPLADALSKKMNLDSRAA